MVPNNFQIELKGLPTATSQFTGVKHVTIGKQDGKTMGPKRQVWSTMDSWYM
jgi:hypothetical protein